MNDPGRWSRESDEPDFCLFGAAGDTGNLGVAALGEASLHSIEEHRPDAEVLVFDNGRGRRKSPADAAIAHHRDGAWISRRFYRAESLWTMRASSVVSALPNRNVSAMRRARAVLDISGGDSFTDLYGQSRWNLVALPKLIALRIGTPLVLLPQTYGPFQSASCRAAAAEIVARSQSSWARDPDGYVAMQELLGTRFDERRHREGVDVAFALPAIAPPDRVVDSLPERRAGQVVVGLNVSGLIMNDPGAAADQFGLTIDYREVVRNTARRLLDEVADRLVLVPHVRAGGVESDDDACRTLAAELGESERVSILPSGISASETKWCISKLDWFCGTRMHATIASLSTGVPASALAYSLKTRGVFETCGMGYAVVDGRSASTSDAIDRLIELAHRRDEQRALLAERAPLVVDRARQQFADILDDIDSRESTR